MELKVRARVTVRTNLEQLIGGATEETIIARVGEGIIASVGAAVTHFEVMENPDRVSRAVLERGLDSHTAFEIVSINIANIEVGQNIGARLQADQAEANTRVARAKAEERRALAMAREQEMKAAVAKNRAMVVLAEADVPLAMADAFRAGKLNSDNASGGANRRPCVATPFTWGGTSLGAANGVVRRHATPFFVRSRYSARRRCVAKILGERGLPIGHGRAAEGLVERWYPARCRRGEGRGPRIAPC